MGTALYTYYVIGGLLQFGDKYSGFIPDSNSLARRQRDKKTRASQ